MKDVEAIKRNYDNKEHMILMCGEYRLPFGKYGGLTMAELRIQDPEYFAWLGPWLDKVPHFEPECKREWTREVQRHCEHKWTGSVERTECSECGAVDELATAIREYLDGGTP